MIEIQGEMAEERVFLILLSEGLRMNSAPQIPTGPKAQTFMLASGLYLLLGFILQ